MKNNILEHRRAVIDNIAKSFCENSEDNLEKARSGIYTDNAENRRLNRVGQKYGSSKKDEQTNTAKDKKDRSVDDYAKTTSTENLRKVLYNENAPKNLRDAAEKELRNRTEQLYSEYDKLIPKISDIIKNSGLDRDYPGGFDSRYMSTMVKNYYTGDLQKIKETIDKSIETLNEDRKRYEDTTWHDNKIENAKKNSEGYSKIIDLLKNSKIINDNKYDPKKPVRNVLEEKPIETLDEHIENITDDAVNMYSLWDKNFGSRDVDENSKEWEDVQRDYYENDKEGKETINKIKAAVKKFGRRQVFAKLSSVSKKDHLWSNKQLKILMSYVNTKK